MKKVFLEKVTHLWTSIDNKSFLGTTIVVQKIIHFKQLFLILRSYKIGLHICTILSS